MFPKSSKAAKAQQPEASIDEMQHYIAVNNRAKSTPSATATMMASSLKGPTSSSAHGSGAHNVNLNATTLTQQRPATSGIGGTTVAMGTSSYNGHLSPLRPSRVGQSTATFAAASPTIITGGTSPSAGGAAGGGAAAVSAARTHRHQSLTEVLPSAMSAQNQWQDRIGKYRNAAALLDKVSRQTGDDMPFMPWLAATMDALRTQLRLIEGPSVLMPNAVQTDFGHNDEDNDGLRATGERSAATVKKALFGVDPSSSLSPSASSSLSPSAAHRSLVALTAGLQQDEGPDVVQRPHPLRSAAAVAILQRLFVNFKLPTSLWRDVLSLIFDSNCANDVLSRDYNGANAIAGYLERRFLCDTVKRLEAERVDLAALNKVAVGQLNKLHDYTLVERQVADGARLRMAFSAWRSLKYLSAWRRIAMTLRLKRGGTMWVRRCFDAWKSFVIIEQLHGEVADERRRAKEVVETCQQAIEDGQNDLRRQLLSERHDHEQQVEEIKSKKLMSEEASVELNQLRDMVSTFRQDQRSYERRIRDLELIVKEQAQNAQMAEETSRRALHALKRTALLMVGTRVMNGIKASDVIVNARGIGTSSLFRFSSNDGVDTMSAASALPSPALSAGFIQLSMHSQARFSAAVGGATSYAGGGGLRKRASSSNATSPSATPGHRNTAVFNNNTNVSGGSTPASVPGMQLVAGGGVPTFFPTGGMNAQSHSNPLELSAIAAASGTINNGVHLASILCSFVNGVIQRDREQKHEEARVAAGLSPLAPNSPMASLANTARHHHNGGASSSSPTALSSSSANGAASSRSTVSRTMMFPGITNIPSAFADGVYYVQLIGIIFGPTCPLFKALDLLVNSGCVASSGDSERAGGGGGSSNGNGNGFAVSPSFARSSVFRSSDSPTSYGNNSSSTPPKGVTASAIRAAFVTEQIFALILLHFDETVRFYGQQTAKIRQKEVVRELLKKNNGGASGNASAASSPYSNPLTSRVGSLGVNGPIPFSAGGGGGFGGGDFANQQQPLTEEEEALLHANEAAFGDVGADVPMPYASSASSSQQQSLSNSAFRPNRFCSVDLINDTLQGHNNYSGTDHLYETGGASGNAEVEEKGPAARLGDLHARLLETPFVVHDFTNADRPLHVAAHFYLVACLLKCYAATKLIPLPQWQSELFSAQTAPHTIPIDVTAIPSMAKAHPAPSKDDKVRQLRLQMMSLQVSKQKAAAKQKQRERGGDGDEDGGEGGAGDGPTVEEILGEEEEDAAAAQPSPEALVDILSGNNKTVLDATTMADALGTCVVLAQASINTWSVLSQYVQEAYFFAFKSVFVLAGVPVVKVFSGTNGVSMEMNGGGGSQSPFKGSASTSPSTNAKRKSTTTPYQQLLNGSGGGLGVAIVDSDDDGDGALAKPSPSTLSESSTGALLTRAKRTVSSSSSQQHQRVTFEGEGPEASQQQLITAANSHVDPSQQDNSNHHAFGHTNEYVSLIRNACFSWGEQQRDREAMELAVMNSTMGPSSRRFLFMPFHVQQHMKKLMRLAGGDSVVAGGNVVSVVLPAQGGVSPLVTAMMGASSSTASSQRRSSNGSTTAAGISNAMLAASAMGASGGNGRRNSLGGGSGLPPSSPHLAAAGPPTPEESALQTMVEVLYELTPSVFVANTVTPTPHFKAQAAAMEALVCYDLPLSATMLDTVFNYAMGLVAAVATSSSSTTAAGGGTAANNGASSTGIGASIYNSVMAATSAQNAVSTGIPLPVAGHAGFVPGSDGPEAVLTHRQWALLMSDINYFGLVGADESAFSSGGGTGQRNSRTKSLTNQMAAEAASMRQAVDGLSRKFAAFSPKEGLLPREFALAMAYIATKYCNELLGNNGNNNNANRSPSTPTNGGANEPNTFTAAAPADQQQQQGGGGLENSDQPLIRRKSSAFFSRSKAQLMPAALGAGADEYTGSLLLGSANQGAIDEQQQQLFTIGSAPTTFRVPKPSSLALFMLMQTRVMPRLGQTTGIFVPTHDTRLQLRAMKNTSTAALSLGGGGGGGTSSPLGPSINNWAWMSIGLGAPMPSAPLSVTDLHHIFTRFRADLRPLWTKYSNECVSVVLAFAKTNGSALATAATQRAAALENGGHPSSVGGGGGGSSGAMLGVGGGGRKQILSSVALKGGAGANPPSSSYDLSRARSGSTMGSAHLTSEPSSGALHSMHSGGSTSVQYHNAANNFSAFIDDAMAPFAVWVHQTKQQATQREKEKAREERQLMMTTENGGGVGADNSPQSMSLSPSTPALSLNANNNGEARPSSKAKGQRNGGSAGAGASSSSAHSHHHQRPYGRNEYWITAVMAVKATAKGASVVTVGGKQQRGGGGDGSDSPSGKRGGGAAALVSSSTVPYFGDGAAVGLGVDVPTNSNAGAPTLGGLLGSRSANIPPAGVLSTFPVAQYSGVAHAVAAFLTFIKKESAAMDAAVISSTGGGHGGGGGRGASPPNGERNASVKRTSSSGAGSPQLSALSAGGGGNALMTSITSMASMSAVQLTLRRTDVVRSIVASVSASVVSKDVPHAPELYNNSPTPTSPSSSSMGYALPLSDAPQSVVAAQSDREELLFRVRQDACQFEAFADMCVLLAMVLWPPPMYQDAARLRLFTKTFVPAEK